jgi:CBS domain-containing protein
MTTLNECTQIEPFHCDETTPVVEVAKLLRGVTLRHIFVTKDGEPTGIISVMDINNRLVAEGKSYEGVTAKDIMTSPITSFSQGADCDDVQKEMLANGWAMSPVVDDNNKMVGIIGIHHLMRK